jgi:hypothetical protein
MTTASLKNDSALPMGNDMGANARQSSTQTSAGSKWKARTGWTLTALSGAFLIFDGVGKLVMPAPVVEATARLGFPVSLIPGVGVLLLVSTLAYLIPRTAILGAILLTGFLGGAVAIQMRAGSPLFENLFPVIFAILMWGGVYLRECRLWGLIPLRR